MAAFQRFTSLSWHVLSNLRKLGRISAVYDRQIIPTRVKHAQIALYSTIINDERSSDLPQVPSSSSQVQSNSPKVQKSETSIHRKNWPTSSFWKNYDYADVENSEMKVFDDFVEMQESESPQSSPKKFYYQMSLKDPTVPWTEEEAVAALQLLSTSRLGLTNQVRLGWINYMVRLMKSHGPVPVSVYNAYLKCYLNLNHAFDPVKVLSEMQETGVGPDQHTLALLLMRYVFMQDIDAARNVYEYIQAEESFRSQESILNMILGYITVGNEEEVVALVQTLSGTCSDAELKKVLYPTLFLGNALVRNENRLKKLGIEINEAGLVDVQTILDMIVVCSYQNATDGAEFLIEFLGRKFGYYNDIIGNSLISLICNGHHELAYKLFSQLQSPSGLKFYIPACRAEMPPDLVYSYTQKMVEKGCRESSFDLYLESLLRHQGCSDLMRKTLPVLKKHDMEIRPVYLWQIIIDIKENGKLEDLMEILPYYQIDMDTEDFFLFPCLEKFQVKSDQWLKLSKESGDFDNDELKILLLSYALHIKDVELVKKMLEKDLPIQKVLGKSEIIRLCRSVKRNLKDSDIFEQFLKSLGLEPEEIGMTYESLETEYQRLLKANHVPKSEVVELATKLLKNKRFKDAKSVLHSANFEQEESGSGLFDCKLFDIPSTHLNKTFAKTLIRHMQGRGYFNIWTTNPEQRMHRLQFTIVVIQNYLKFIIESGDDQEVIEFLNMQRNRYELETVTAYSSLTVLHEQSRADSIQKVLKHLKHASWPPDRIGLCVAISLIENNKMDKAEMALQQITVRAETCIRLFTYLRAEQKFEVMEKLYNFITKKFSLTENVKSKLSKLMKKQGIEKGETPIDEMLTDEPLNEIGKVGDNNEVENSIENTENNENIDKNRNVETSVDKVKELNR